MTRRQSLIAVASLVSTALLHGCGTEENTISVLPGPSPSPFPPTPSPSPLNVAAFLQPPLRQSVNGALNTSIDCRFATNTVGGMRIRTRTFEGMIGGPTLVVGPGETLRINMTNSFPPNPDPRPPANMNTPHGENSTNNHVHGMHVSPGGNSDNVFVEIDPGESFPYEYKIPLDHPTGTYWYHPHKHGSTTVQLFGGMGGALLVKGPGLDTVPEVAAARDLVYLINELNIDPRTGEVQPFLAVPDDIYDISQRILTVNGVTTPVLTMRAGEVARLRVLNATVTTTIPFQIDGHELHVCALDGVTFNHVRTAPFVELGAANRADVLVRAGAPGIYTIRKRNVNTEFQPDPELIIGYLEVVGPALSPPMALPTTLPGPGMADITASEIVRRRTLVFSIDGNIPAPLSDFPNFFIDAALFNPNVVNHSVKLNTAEEWTLLNTSGEAHPFHIHVNDFQVISINDVPLPIPEWHDTINIPPASGNTPGKVVIRHRFTDFTGLFVLHCHILIHEDMGMMQTVEVVP